MRPALLLTLFSCFGFFPQPQQDNIWRDVAPKTRLVKLRTATLSPKQLAIVRKALAARVRLDDWPCADGGEPDWVEKVSFSNLPVSAPGETVLVQAGMGCARGGQGANGAMWIVQFHADRVLFLATPQQNFSGWLYSIQPTTSHGLHDLVLGWHMSAAEAKLSYLRFEGGLYRLIGTATLRFDENYVGTIVPTPNSQGQR